MKKIILFILLACPVSWGALNLMTWDGSKNSDFNDTANWTGTAASGTTLTAGDSCLFNTGSTAATVSASVAVGALVVNGYTGTISLQTYTLTVSGVKIDLGGATLAAGTSTLVITSAAAIGVTSAGKTWYDVTVNRSTAGTITWNDSLKCHTYTISGTNTRAVTHVNTGVIVSGDYLADGSGGVTTGNFIVANGASSQVHFGSTNTFTSTATALTMNTATAGVIADNKGITAKSLTLGAGAVVTNGGGVITTYTNSVTALTLGESASLTCTRGINFTYSASCDIWAIGSGATVVFSSSSSISPTITGLTLTVPTISASGAGGINLASTASDVTFRITGAINLGIGTFASQSFIATAATYLLDFNNQNVTCGSFNVGARNALTTFTVNYGSGSFSVSGVSGTTYNVGTINENLQTSTWSCSGNWIFGGNHTINPGSSKIKFTGNGVATWTLNGKHLAWFVDSGSAASKLTLADSLYADSSCRLWSGKFNDGGKAIYVRDWYNYSADSTVLSGNKFITRDFYRDALAALVVNENANTIFTGNSPATASLNGRSVNKWFIRKIKGTTFTLLNSLRCAWLQNDTSIFIQADTTFDSTLINRDSIAWQKPNYVYKKDSSTTTARNSYGVEALRLYMGTEAGNTWCTGANRGPLTVAMTGSGSWTFNDTLRCTIKKRLSGLVNEIHPMYVTALIDSSADSLNADSARYISGVDANGNSLVRKAGVKKSIGANMTNIFNGAGKINTGGGAIAPTTINANMSIYGGGTIAALSFGLQDEKLTFQTGKRCSVTTLTTAGASDHLDSLVSSASAPDTLAAQTGATAAYTYFANTYSTKPIDARTGGKQVNSWNILTLAGLSSPQSPQSDTVGKAIVPINHALTNGLWDSLVYKTTLPAGLTYSKSTGTVTGSPLAAVTKAGYIYRAYSANGTDSLSAADTIIVVAATVPTTSRRRHNGALSIDIDRDLHL